MYVYIRAVDRPLFFGLAWPVACPAVSSACLDSDGGRLLGFLAWPGLAWQANRRLPQAKRYLYFFYCKNSKPTD